MNISRMSLQRFHTLYLFILGVEEHTTLEFHKIPAWQGLEGTSGDHPVQPLPKQGQLLELEGIFAPMTKISSLVINLRNTQIPSVGSRLFLSSEIEAKAASTRPWARRESAATELLQQGTLPPLPPTRLGLPTQRLGSERHAKCFERKA